MNDELSGSWTVTIRRAQPWGRHGSLPLDAPIAHNDAELCRLVAQARSASAQQPQNCAGQADPAPAPAEWSGPDGSAGWTVSDGAVGRSGSDGAVGRSGSDGPVGRSGSDGPAGPTEPAGPVGLLGGDLWRCLGAPTGGIERLRSSQAWTATVDLVRIALVRPAAEPSGQAVSAAARERGEQEHSTTAAVPSCPALAAAEQHWMCAHLIARNSWWFGRCIAVMNVEQHGRWKLAPAAHPNDGRLHIIDLGAPGAPGMDVRQRFLARRRLRSGEHLPHPALRTRRAQQVELSFAAPLRVRIDGIDVGRAVAVSVAVEPDAVIVVV